MRVAALFGRWLAMAASAQAAVAGGYAWAVTVMPPAFASGSAALARVSAAVGLAALVAGAIGERRWGSTARVASLWTFVLSSALTWSVSPSQLAPARVDAVGGLSGMLGWGLFAMASAGPALGGSRGAEGTIADAPLEARKRLSRGDAAYVFGGFVLCVAFQIVGWGEVNAERALLIRFVALAAGLAITGAAAEIAFARHGPRNVRPWRSRARASATAFTLLGMLVLAGLLIAVAR